MIRFDKVSKVYESRGYHHLVLNNLNFTVEPRTSLGICGANGSGKSTLMRVLAGVEYPTTGRVTRTMTTSWPLGYTSAFQASLTGADNVRFISRIYGKDSRMMLDFVEEFAALGPFFRQPIFTYSAGMVARLQEAGKIAGHFLEFDAVAEGVSWFDALGSKPVRIVVPG